MRESEKRVIQQYIAYTAILFSGLYDWFIWHLIPDYLSLLGIMLIVVATLIVFLKERKAEKKRPSAGMLILSIDLINELTHGSGKLAHLVPFMEQHHIIAHANQIIHCIHRIPVAHVKVGFSENYKESALRSPIFNHVKALNALQLKTWGTAFHDDLDTQPQDTLS